MLDSIEKEFELNFQSLLDGRQDYGSLSDPCDATALLGLAALGEMALRLLRAMIRRIGRSTTRG